MSFSIVLFKPVVSVDSLLTCQKTEISKLSLQQSVCTQTKCHAELHESFNLQNDRKCRRVFLSEQSDCKRHRSETLTNERVISMLATITFLEHQVSSLKKLLHQVYVSLHTTSIKHNCSALFCEKSFTNLKHLYRHIRDQNDSTHESLAVLINETHCLICLKICSRSFNLVRHEKKIHDETYRSRLDKFLDTSMSLSSSSSDSMIVHDLLSR